MSESAKFLALGLCLVLATIALIPLPAVILGPAVFAQQPLWYLLCLPFLLPFLVGLRFLGYWYDLQADERYHQRGAALRWMLLERLKERAFQTGTFMLASGRISSYYLDCKRAILKSDTLFLVSEVLCDALQPVFRKGVEAIGGPEVGAIPIVSALAVRCYTAGLHVAGGPRIVETFFVRRQPKSHGSRSLVEGRLNALNDRVIVVEDVVTTGESVLRTIQEVEKCGARVVKVICLVDRLEGGAELLKDYAFESLFTIRDFGVEPPTVRTREASDTWPNI